MPLVRVEVRNEYGLGLPELYKEADREDPKAVLDGVAVAGLVGILRQLGDLAEFAAEVFHGLQEQVMSTASRSNKLKARVQNIEIALAPIEKAVLAQRNHLHFAYTTGSHWHLRIRNEQNHFIYSDLPRFIMDSYEDCRSPPRLNLLDKFDSDGPGSCLKRYSDPTFFRTASASSYDVYIEKVSRDKKTRRRKKKRTSSRNRELPHGITMSSHSGRTQSTPIHFDEHKSPFQSVSASDVAYKSSDIAFKAGDQSISFDSQTESGFIDCNFHPIHTDKSEENNPTEPITHHNNTISSPQINEQTGSILDDDDNDNDNDYYNDGGDDDDNDDIRNSFSRDQTGPSSSFVTWDEKMEIIDRAGQQHSDDHDEPVDTRDGDVNFIIVDHSMDFHFENQNNTNSQLEDIESETDNYMDALNTIESEPETDLDCQTKREVEQLSEVPLPAFDPEPSEQLSRHDDISELSENVVTNIPSDVCREVDLPIPMNSISEPQDSPVLPSGEVRPVMIWTNGNLLGLEPSKPPDFTKSNGVGKNPVPLPVPEVQEEPVKISMDRPEMSSGVDQESKNVQASEAMNSSRMVEFGNRLLVNGFKRQTPFVDDNNNHATAAKKYESPPLISPSSSPPLSHMKILFQPSFDTSRLKLKLPDNNKNNHSAEDLFPSFQLVPEPSNSLHEAGSDSDDDDDSFNRSSPYISDDYSDSNSDNWESSGTPNNRISTTESVSSSLGIGLTSQLQGPFIDFGGEFGQSGHFDLPTFDSLKSSFNQDFIVDSDGKMEIPSEPAPLLPPLPPMEWICVTQDSLSEEINHAFDSMLLSSTNSQQPKPAPVNHNENVEEILCTPENQQQNPNKLDEQKTSNPKEDDFLHQIRAKSLNLRRTTTSQPVATTTGGVSSSVKVTAILEKASAIRQAVGSDDGEDDNWSDS